jgi:anti-anti-sigma factor
MTHEPTPEMAPPLLCIEGELTIFRAGEIRELLLAQPPHQKIDLSGVTEMDSAGLQLLLAAKQAANAAQRPLRLIGASPAVQEVVELLNVSAHFGAEYQEAAQ